MNFDNNGDSEMELGSFDCGWGGKHDCFGFVSVSKIFAMYIFFGAEPFDTVQFELRDDQVHSQEDDCTNIDAVLTLYNSMTL